MSVKLLPCPWCGQPGEVYPDRTVGCSNHYVFRCGRIDRGIELWNKRHLFDYGFFDINEVTLSFLQKYLQLPKATFEECCQEILRIKSIDELDLCKVWFKTTGQQVDLIIMRALEAIANYINGKKRIVDEKSHKADS